MKKSVGETSNARTIKNIILLDGSRVGIINLDSILNEVAELNLKDTDLIKKQLIRRVKKINYVPSSAEDEYSTALFHEYRKKFDESEAGRTEAQRHSSG